MAPPPIRVLTGLRLPSSTPAGQLAIRRGTASPDGSYPVAVEVVTPAIVAGTVTGALARWNGAGWEETPTLRVRDADGALVLQSTSNRSILHAYFNDEDVLDINSLGVIRSTQAYNPSQYTTFSYDGVLSNGPMRFLSATLENIHFDSHVIFKSEGVTATPLTLQAAAGQSAPLLQLLASDGATGLFSINPLGVLGWGLQGADPSTAPPNSILRDLDGATRIKGATAVTLDAGGHTYNFDSGGKLSLSEINVQGTGAGALTGLPVYKNALQPKRWDPYVSPVLLDGQDVVNTAVFPVDIYFADASWVVPNSASFYVHGPNYPNGGGAAGTITNNWSVWVKQGPSRFGGDVLHDAGVGPVLVDRTTGTRYRLLVNSGTLSIEAA